MNADQLIYRVTQRKPHFESPTKAFPYSAYRTDCYRCIPQKIEAGQCLVTMQLNERIDELVSFSHWIPA